MNGNDVVAEARKCLGIPFQHQGRTEHGLDCVGLVIFVCARLNVLPIDIERNNYGRLPEAELLSNVQKHCTRTDSAEDGALVLFCWPGDSHPGHAGISAGQNIIHCYSNAGRVVEHGLRGKWSKTAHSFWRLPGVI